MAISPEVAEIIRRKKTQYCRFADTNQFHLDKIALPDATFKFVGPDGTILNQHGVDHYWTSSKDFVAFFNNFLDKIQSIHSIGPGELAQTGPDEVKAIWTVIYHVGPKGSTDVKGHGTGGGHYHEVWKRQGDDWFLADLTLERTYWIVRD
ncbi:hypothetical protein VP1G_04509 [Cytospora mali]|uniref:SnoaL-like domain-containing protein n=1 Tax=Cytospora mali TaxID=578113 RepID=A0A194UZZ5_CYTMA|nr:hypothetical protein VP1G_04509 [Valsa mali var. pyri (nom. inval.)]